MEEDSVVAQCAKISQFFAPKKDEKKATKRHRYFDERGLQRVAEL